MDTVVVILLAFFGTLTAIATCTGAVIGLLNSRAIANTAAHLKKQDGAIAEQGEGIHAINISVDGRMTEMTEYIKRLVDSQNRTIEMSKAAWPDSTATLRTKLADVYQEATSVIPPANTPAPTTAVVVAQADAAKLIKAVVEQIAIGQTAPDSPTTLDISTPLVDGEPTPATNTITPAPEPPGPA